MQSILQDLRFGFRQLRRDPSFTAVALLTLALGIGGTTAIFSVLYGAVLDPMPYAESHRVFFLDSLDKQGRILALVSAPEFLDFQAQNHVFDEVFGLEAAAQGSLLTTTDGSEALRSARVTGNFFGVMGVRPLIGRYIMPSDCQPGAPPVAVIGHRLWQEKFGGDPRILGRALVLDARPTTVIGVMPPRFRLLKRDVWLPATFTRDKAEFPWGYFWLGGHLKPGVSPQEASADVAVLSKRLAAAYPGDHPSGRSFAIEPLAWVDRDLRTTLYMLLGAVGLLLLIACLNLANLLLARATSREKEFEVRLSLGATHFRLVRQLLIEGLLLALVGAGLGCLLAWDVLRGLVALIPPGTFPGEAEIRVNAPVLVFTLGMALLSTLLFALAPAIFAVRKGLQEPLKAGGKGGGNQAGHKKLRSLLVVSEVALSFMLLTGGALLIRSFMMRRHAEPGFSPDHVLVARGSLPLGPYNTAEKRNQFYREVLRRVRALPGVFSAALGDPPPTSGIHAEVEIPHKLGSENGRANLHFVSDRFFETMQIRLLQGRAVSEEDIVRGEEVAVVNERFAASNLGREIPLGRQIKVTWFGGSHMVETHWFEIVGAVADVRDLPDGPEAPAQPEIYVPGVSGDLIVRTMGQPQSLLTVVPQTIAAVDKQVPLFGASTMQQEIDETWYMQPRLVMTVLVAFATLGLALVSIGVYGVLSHSVSQRTQEIGIRRALGAQATDVHRMVIKSGARWLMAGMALGVPASVALAKLLQNRIWGVKSADPLTLIVVSAALTVVGLAACYFPARRATEVDPLVALRYE